MKKYVAAAESALQVSEKKDQDREEIFKALHELIDEITEWKNGAIVLRIKVKKSSIELNNEFIGTALGNMIGLNLKNQFADKSVENNNKTLDYVLTAGNKVDTYDITDISLSNLGYPCSIYVDGNKVTSYDLNTFEESLGNLISSVHVGDIFRKLLKN